MTENELQAAPAVVAGVAQRISAADKALVVLAQPAVVRATIHITRKATGLIETYELIGTPVAGD